MNHLLKLILRRRCRKKGHEWRTEGMEHGNDLVCDRCQVRERPHA